LVMNICSYLRYLLMLKLNVCRPLRRFIEKSYKRPALNGERLPYTIWCVAKNWRDVAK